MFRTDCCVVKSRRYRMREHDLPVVILQHKRARALQHTERTAPLEPCRMFASLDSFTTRFDPHHSNLFVTQEGIKQSDGVAAASDTRHELVRQALFLLQNLSARFATDHCLKIANHHRVWVRAENAAEDV